MGGGVQDIDALVDLIAMDFESRCETGDPRDWNTKEPCDKADIMQATEQLKVWAKGFLNALKSGKDPYGEPFNLPSSGSLIQTFRVSFLAHAQRNFHVHLEKFIPDAFSNFQAVSLIRRNKRHQRNHPGVREQLGNLANSANVFFAIVRRETQVRVQSVSDVIPVQRDHFVPSFEQLVFERIRDGGFPGS